jgi:hypothetical protein
MREMSRLEMLFLWFFWSEFILYSLTSVKLLVTLHPYRLYVIMDIHYQKISFSQNTTYKGLNLVAYSP